uniref:hypothetical protein n=1 Tax=Sinorhizobium sp. M14 TaxID=430451 RepID=UPI001565DBAB|nr:hypothetical protein [Sinorhizobium sp. M14]
MKWQAPTVGVYTLAVRYAEVLTPADRATIEQIAVKWGFVIDNNLWTPPESNEGIPGFRNELARAGYGSKFEEE